MAIPWVIARPTSIWGPWFGIPYRGFFDAVRRGYYVHPQGEKIYKTYGYVGNVAYQLAKLLSVSPNQIDGKTLYVADYEAVEIGSMAEAIRRQFGARPVRNVPVGMLRMLAAAGDVCRKAGWRNPPLTSFRLNNLREQMKYDIQPTADVVGALPYTVDEGIAMTVAWMKQRDAMKALPDDSWPETTVLRNT
jgi:nucleoside-diphosphate-sugar epimerase